MFLHMLKQLVGAFYSFLGNTVEFDEMPLVMLLGSVLVEAEDDQLGKEKLKRED